MGRAPCCDKANVKKGPWSSEEDAKLKDYIEKYGTGGNWIALPQKAGLRRCGKSCRLRWLNYLRPNIKHGEFSDEEDRIICTLFATIGSRWSIIAAQLPGRTDNDIKNYWNTKLKKKLLSMIFGSGSVRSSSSSSSSQSKPPILLSSHHHHHHQNPNETSFSTSQQLQQYSTNFFPIINVPPPINSNIPSNFSSLPSSNFSSSMFQMDCSAYPNDHNNLLKFGNDHKASCSTTSSEEMSFQSCISEGFHDEDHSKKLFMFNSYGNNGGDNSDQKPNWYVGQSPLDYNLEEIKQLIRSSSRSNNNSIGCIEENETEDKFMYYY